MAKHRAIIIGGVSEMLEAKQSMKIKMRLHITYEKPVQGFDDDVEWLVKDGHMSNKMIHTVVKNNIKSVIDKQVNEMATKLDTLELVDDNGKPLGSNWSLKSIDKLAIDVYETKPLRASSYIPTPSKYSNLKCGLINIQNKTDDECFKWCMLYHQSEKGKNDTRLSALKNINDKYSYEDITFLVSYEDITLFADMNKVFIFVYEIEDDKIVKSREGNTDYILNEIVYLLRIEENDKAHYIYIKK